MSFTVISRGTHLMKLLSCRALMATIFLVSIASALGDRAVIAQSGSSPTVTILRNTPVEGPIQQLHVFGGCPTDF
jgi:hypothetical protein